MLLLIALAAATPVSPLLAFQAPATPEAPRPGPVRGVALGLSAAGEAITQGGLVDAYPKLSGSLSFEAITSISWRLPIETTLEVGYRRVEGGRSDDSRSWIWYVPASLLVSGRLDVAAISLLAGAGPSVVAWEEEASEAAVAGRLDWGARWGASVEASVRWHTPFLRPSLSQAGRGGPTGLDLFVSAGGRVSHVADSVAQSLCNGEPCGFDWSAARVSGGALVRF